MPSTLLTQMQHNATLDISSFNPDDQHPKARLNKIVCTIGPKTQSVEKIKGLIQSGLAIVRNNFSHGTHEYHAKTIANARQAAAELGQVIAIALDTKGPEIRTGNFPDGEVFLKVGDKVVLSTDKKYYNAGTKDIFYVDYENITKVIKKGDKIYIDDGLLGLHVEEVNSDSVTTTVINEAAISNHKGVNLPNVEVDLPAVTEKDKKDLAFGVEQDVDMIFASFIRNAKQVEEVREALGPKGKDILIISKIENQEGVEKFDEILAVSDGIMVARGDLGIEIPAEKVFVAQKMMISKCNIAGKPVICATQMLESMTQNPRPTRAEVSDVANAVLDGADCVMLSGETAKGAFPEACVRVMSHICLEAQNARQRALAFHSVRSYQDSDVPVEESIASSTVNSAFELNAKAIIVLSNSGKTARLVAKYNPACPIAVCVKSESTARKLSIVRGVYTYLYPNEDDNRLQRVQFVLDHLKEEKLVSSGDRVIAVHADTETTGLANQTRVIVV